MYESPGLQNKNKDKSHIRNFTRWIYSTLFWTDKTKKEGLNTWKITEGRRLTSSILRVLLPFSPEGTGQNLEIPTPKSKGGKDILKK